MKTFCLMGKQRGPKLTITQQICLDLLFKDCSLRQGQGLLDEVMSLSCQRLHLLPFIILVFSPTLNMTCNFLARN